MVTPEKLFEMMNPTKAFEAMSQSKVFDVKSQSRFLESAADQATELVGIYQTQTRKVVEFWLDQSEEAVKQGQKFVKEWAAQMAKAGTEIASEVEANVKEAAKVLELPKAKAAKSA